MAYLVAHNQILYRLLWAKIAQELNMTTLTIITADTFYKNPIERKRTKSFSKFDLDTPDSFLVTFLNRKNSF